MSSDLYSDKDVFASLALREWKVDPEDDGRDSERYRESAASEGLWYPAADRKLEMPTRGYYPERWPRGAIVHFTAGRCQRGDADAEATIKFGKTNSHCYFCISTTGRVYQTAPLDRWGSHAGESEYAGLGEWVSSKLVGIEICCAGSVKRTERGYEPWWNTPGATSNTYFQEQDVRTVSAGDNVLSAGTFHRYTAAQEASLIELLTWLHTRNPSIFKLDYVLGHDEVSPRRKDDPGGSLSMTMPALRRALKERVTASAVPVASVATGIGSPTQVAMSAPPPETRFERLGGSAFTSPPDLEALRRVAGLTVMTEEDVDRARGARDFVLERRQPLEARRSAEPAPRLSDDEVRALISNEAVVKIIEFEVSSEAYYRKAYQRPILPGVQSGITVGVGYDLGYNEPEDVRRDFDGLLPAPDIEAMAAVCGLTGSEARAHLDGLKRRVSVPWEVAREVFRRATLPRFGRTTLSVFPNVAELKGHAFGMLVSLVYNRGDSLEGERRRHMKQIRDLAAARRWSEIPEQFRAMKRIWEGDPGARGLLARRDAEAALFERGLELMQGMVVASAGPAMLERRGTPDLARLEGDGYYYRDLDDTAGLERLERRDAGWDKVSWPADDRQSPDYGHIPERQLSGGVFQFGARELELLFEANAFAPSREHGRIVFALRGAELVDLETQQPSSPQENREVLGLRETRPDHRSFRCVIGVYDVERGRLYGYSASTVPNPKAVASFVAGGDPSNMMLTGCYEFQVGWHQESKSRKKIPGCLIEYGRSKAVLRSKNNHTFELSDIIEDTSPGDNVHPGKSEGPFPFSSWGCLVLKGSVEPLLDGDRENVKHIGEWALFRKAIGLPERGTGGHGRKIDVVLLTGLEAIIATRARLDNLDPRSPIFRQQLHRLRQGSRGWRVARLRAALGLPRGDVFTSEVAARLAELQRTKTGGAFGLYAPHMDATLGLDIFSSEPQIAMLERRSAGGARKPAIRDELAYELGVERELSLGGRVLSEDAHHEGLLSKAAELGTQALVLTGNALLREAELTLKSYVCEGDALGRYVDRDGIRKRVDEAAQTSRSALKHVLVNALRQGSFGFAGYDLTERVVGYILDEILLPNSGQMGDELLGRVDGGIAWLCSKWSERIALLYPDAVVATQVSPAPVQPAPVPAATPVPSAAVGLPSPLAPSPEASRLLALLKSAADRDDVAGARSYIRELRDFLRTSGESLMPDQHGQFLDILCDSRFMGQLSGATGRDPYLLLGDIDDALAQSELDRATVEGRVRQLCDLLCDARLKLDPDRIEKTIAALRKRRLSELVSVLADRVLTREPDPALLGRIGPHYALALIDSQRVVAGIEVLHATLEKGQLSKVSAAEAWGGLGRAHKQIYVNHVRTQSDAVALKQTLQSQLVRAIDAYDHLYDPARPGDNSWHGVNLVALLMRARADRVTVPSRLDPDLLAKGLIAAIEPGIGANKDDHWRLATLGEAYLAQGNVERAAYYYAAFASHEKTDAFSLNSAIRQLEEVWRLQAGSAGADTLLVGLKGALAQKDNSRIVLTKDERLAIASNKHVGHQEHFESRVQGGKFMPLAYLKLLVETGMAVAAIKQRSDTGPVRTVGAGETVGTGFLVEGSALGLPPGNRYLLTNAHVLWDATLGQGVEQSALAPEAAEIVFEGATGPSDIYKCRSVLWQSPSGLHDATLIELDRVAEGIKPLVVAKPETTLVADDGSGNQGTKLSVVGHPEGGALSIGFAGSLEDISARLVDKGPRGLAGDPVYLHYSVPTEPGNSGSPVLETEKWQVVGLHHAGFSEAQGRPKLGGKAGANRANEGVCIQSIRAGLKDYSENAGKKRRRGFF